MHAVGLRGHSQVEMVVDDEQRALAVGVLADAAGGRQEASLGGGLVAQLDDFGAAVDGPAEDLCLQFGRRLTRDDVQARAQQSL